MIELVSEAGGGNLQALDRSRCPPPPFLQTYFPIMANPRWVELPARGPTFQRLPLPRGNLQALDRSRCP